MASAGFRRYSTYRQAMLASVFTNSIFGFLRCYVLLAALKGSGSGLAGGYDAAQLATYAWVPQGLLGVVALWGWTDLGDRIRTGDVVADLLRPIHPFTSYLAIDLGRAGHAALTRFVVPVAVGATFFDLYAPHRLATYPLFVVSVALAVLICFGCRYLVNAAAFWLLDMRGANLVWMLASNLLTGLAFPLHFLPSLAERALWVATPFPSIIQAPLDILVERGGTSYQSGLLAGQVVWAAIMAVCCVAVQHRAERRMVIQGG